MGILSASDEGLCQAKKVGLSGHGYQAVLQTLQYMREAFLEEKDMRSLIQIKGMGCEGCI